MADKFIFVNAPTIVNAGPRDARRHLRSQLMRRVYLKKYKVSPPSAEEDGVGTRNKDLSDSPEQCHCSPPSVSTRPSSPDDGRRKKNKAGKKKRAVKSRIPPESKLPTPPIDDDELDVCETCGGISHESQQDPSDTLTEVVSAKDIITDRQRGDGDPKMNIGASVFDPFEQNFGKKDCPNSNVLIQHFFQVLIPALRNGREWSPKIVSEYIQLTPDPLIFHVLCLSSAVHRDKLMLWSGADSDRHQREMEKSHYRYTALRELRRAVSTYKIGTPAFDAILVSVCLLSVSDPMGELPSSITERDYNPFHHVLQPLGGLNIYGYQPVHRVHWKGLLALLDQHGGFDKIQLYGAKWKIAYTALKYALHTGTKPVFPMCNHLGESLIELEPLDILGLTPSDLPPLTSSGFTSLDMFSIRDSIQQVFVEISQVAQSMNMLVPQWDDKAVRDLMADARNLVQYRFLNLPTLSDDPSLIADLSLLEGSKQATAYARSIMEVASSVYGMCWLVTYLFTTHVTFPVPSSRRFRVKIVFQIRDAISNCGYALQHNRWVLKLQLWCVVIAGIAAEDVDADLRQWMALKARDLYTELGLQGWEEVLDVMTSFAWMEVACAHGARKFWAQVQSYDD
ncbi:conserved hypothetical protein [Talaromyces stipitatus ATCC 10500]|uniref:Uncharacterized protein n=1 Tax=Talaromyces stipitatus (strain ATCC 10500 / CBS 375.48 / QM 6759 / NRRL 1006) TaxID=441959 RepID=B8MJ04_TALSN|nr:uncharacterized protein TSTA_051040 [Talaromyces stipitatus ATCC 10500]EED15666.1 conserved hypothetical protein [Talaromyces stipitatus ATCC 10500]